MEVSGGSDLREQKDEPLRRIDVMRLGAVAVVPRVSVVVF
jgi:hypothetical protein